MSGRFSFEVVDAADYDDLRPGYAPDAVAWVVQEGGLGPGSTVVDLAAGTGQLSRHLVAMRLDVVAVEPASNMRSIFAERLPSVHVVDAAAEAMPFEDGSIDGVVVGNAFHHFARDAAFAEIHRVLRPGGSLSLFWAWPFEEEQRRVPAMDRIDEMVQRARKDSAIIAAYRSWADPPSRAVGFEPFVRREFPLVHVLPSARLADLYATSSDVASMPRERRTQLLTRIDELAGALPEILRLPTRTVVDRCTREDWEPAAGAGEGNRTPVSSLGSSRSAIEPHPRGRTV
jgi:SAM-dependent methyltransferase